MRKCWGIGLALLLLTGIVHADGTGDNAVDGVRRIPPPGVTVSDNDKMELQTGIATLGREIGDLRTGLKSKPTLLALLPDVEIYYNAVHYALTYNEFFSNGEVSLAKTMLKHGMDRADALKAGKAPWTTQTGPTARGYISKIDGSVQPYGIVVPDSYQANDGKKHRLDIWFHGRGETLSELVFINDREHSKGEFAPADAFVLHPYGRYCNANKFAGEVDTFEGLDAVRRNYPIDEDRIAVRGFSMGGAACWQFGTHFAGQWAAIAPGAGFSETPDFLKVYQNETLKPYWWEVKLWHIYDSIDYAVNLFNCPTIAYSGELDGQRQAAEMMTVALAKENMTLVHVIGPGAHHFYEAKAKLEVARLVDAAVAKGRDDAPKTVKFTTWTLRYNRMKWVTVDSLEHHWDRARVEATVGDDHGITAKTSNVTALTLSPPAVLVGSGRTSVVLDGQKLAVAKWPAHFRRTSIGWSIVGSPQERSLAKAHGLQGPIDDAFMDSFIMVRPTGTPLSPGVGGWAAQEMGHAIDHWRRQYRGEARVKDDTDISADDIANSNLVLWGDPSSNRILAKIANRLPIKWDAHTIKVGGKSYSSETDVPILIYPNPLNPKHYIVLNSGFTFREYDYLNNARQNAKLPDWAVVDTTTPPSSRWPGKIVDANFFGEHWELLPEQPLQ